jgi:hypothetical protein
MDGQAIFIVDWQVIRCFLLFIVAISSPGGRLRDIL